jgi:hypothetical protein
LVPEPSIMLPSRLVDGDPRFVAGLVPVVLEDALRSTSKRGERAPAPHYCRSQAVVLRRRSALAVRVSKRFDLLALDAAALRLRVINEFTAVRAAGLAGRRTGRPIRKGW